MAFNPIMKIKVYYEELKYILYDKITYVSYQKIILKSYPKPDNQRMTAINKVMLCVRGSEILFFKFFFL